eukprot:632196-Alexandrium_andersonii.AAC.1
MDDGAIVRLQSPQKSKAQNSKRPNFKIHSSKNPKSDLPNSNHPMPKCLSSERKPAEARHSEPSPR